MNDVVMANPALKYKKHKRKESLSIPATVKKLES